jgi:hypothetical protein
MKSGPIESIPMGRETRNVAICTFENRVSPRFDLSIEILIYDQQDLPEKGPLEKIHASSLTPEEKVRVLFEKEIEAVVVGGIQERYQEMLLSHQITVIWGVIGELKEVLHAYRRDSLYPGIGRVSDL